MLINIFYLQISQLLLVDMGVGGVLQGNLTPVLKSQGQERKYNYIEYIEPRPGRGEWLCHIVQLHIPGFDNFLNCAAEFINT